MTSNTVLIVLGIVLLLLGIVAAWLHFTRAQPGALGRAMDRAELSRLPPSLIEHCAGEVDGRRVVLRMVTVTGRPLVATFDAPLASVVSDHLKRGAAMAAAAKEEEPHPPATPNGVSFPRTRHEAPRG